MKIVVNRKKINRILLFLGCIVAYSAVIFVIIPVYESLLPRLVQMEGMLYSGAGVTEPAYGLAFWGSNLDDIETIYIDGVKNDDCQIKEESNYKIVVDIPPEIYQGRDSFVIQVSKRVGGIYACKGEKYEVQVTEYTREAPRITGLSSEVIYRMQESQNIVISIEDWDEEVHIYVNGTEIPAITRMDENVLEISVNPEIYDGKDYIEIMPVAEFGRGQRLYGSAVKLNVVDVDDDTTSVQ